eukprot:7883089-Prorocentrum_lima.AAC.1
MWSWRGPAGRRRLSSRQAPAPGPEQTCPDFVRSPGLARRRTPLCRPWPVFSRGRGCCWAQLGAGM